MPSGQGCPRRTHSPRHVCRPLPAPSAGSVGSACCRAAAGRRVPSVRHRRSTRLRSLKMDTTRYIIQRPISVEAMATEVRMPDANGQSRQRHQAMRFRQSRHASRRVGHSSPKSKTLSARALPGSVMSPQSYTPRSLRPCLPSGRSARLASAHGPLQMSSPCTETNHRTVSAHAPHC